MIGGESVKASETSKIRAKEGIKWEVTLSADILGLLQINGSVQVEFTMDLTKIVKFERSDHSWLDWDIEVVLNVRGAAMGREGCVGWRETFTSLVTENVEKILVPSNEM